MVLTRAPKDFEFNPCDVEIHDDYLSYFPLDFPHYKNELMMHFYEYFFLDYLAFYIFFLIFLAFLCFYVFSANFSRN